MNDAKTTADKYISRGGGDPVASAKEYASDILKLGSFVLWHDPRHIQGGVSASDAYAAMCRLLNVEQHRIREIIRPE